MAQTDITTFSPIIFWSFIFILISFLFFYFYFMPVFIGKLKILSKIKNISFFKTLFIFDKIKSIESFYLILSLNNIIKDNKTKI